MMIAIDDNHWIIITNMPVVKLFKVLRGLAANVELSAFRKHPRGPKKVQPKRKSAKNKPHVSTAKILSQRTN